MTLYASDPQYISGVIEAGKVLGNEIRIVNTIIEVHRLING